MSLKDDVRSAKMPSLRDKLDEQAEAQKKIEEARAKLEKKDEESKKIIKKSAKKK